MREMKDSGVEWIGEIPKNKKIIRNKYMFKYEKGKLPSNTNTEKIGVPYIGASDLDSNTDEYVIYTEDETLPDAKIDDLLVLWDGARAGLAGTKKCGKISSTIVKISADDTVYTSFLYWYYKGFEKYMSDSVTGTTIPHMNRKYIEDIQFIDWGIDEQKKMTEYLDEKCAKIDAIIEKQQEIIEKLKEYKLSVINEKTKVNTGVRCHLSYLGQMKNGLNFSDIDDGVKIMFLGVGDFKDYYVLDNETMFSTVTVNEEDLSDELMLESGDIIFVRSNGSKELVGRAVMVDDIDFKLTYTGFAIRYRNIRKDVINNKYLLYYFRSPDFRKLLEKNSQGSNISNLSQDLLGNIEINIPNMDYQNRAVSYLDEKCKLIDKTIEDRQRAIAKLQEYKKSLIYEVVTGKREV